MNRSLLTILLLSIYWLTLTSLTNPYSEDNNSFAVLKIEVTQIKNLNGSSIHIGIFDKEGFPKDNKAIYSKHFIPSKSQASTQIKVPKGTYAVALYHDVNKNNKFDKTMLGFPKEPYGLSNNFKPTLSEPKFEDCSFKITDKSHTLSIALIH